MTKFEKLSVELHERGQSRMNSELRLDSAHVYPKGAKLMNLLQVFQDLQVNTKKSPCYEGNNHSATQCADNYIEDRMGCNLPWLERREGFSLQTK